MKPSIEDKEEEWFKGIEAALDRYLKDGLKPGGFLMSVLEGNLYLAYRLSRMQGRFVFTVEKVLDTLPPLAYGNPASVKLWIAAEGLSKSMTNQAHYNKWIQEKAAQ